MTDNNKYISNNGCLTKEGIKYLLTHEEASPLREKMEGHIKVCELCQEAYEGYKKTSNIDILEQANINLQIRFYASRKKNKSYIHRKHILSIATTAAAIVIAIVVVKQLTSIGYIIEENAYTEELAFLSKEEINKPLPPARPRISIQQPASNQEKEEIAITEKPEIKKIDIETQTQIGANNLPSKKVSQKLNGLEEKKLVDKSYTEFQITLPVEVDRYGYSYHDNHVVTGSYEKGVALSALPSFKGKGMEGFVKYVSENINYPAEARDNLISGVVKIQFAIDVDGSVADIEIKKSIYPTLDREAYRIIKNSPKWIPGFDNGRPTKVYLMFPVSFQIE